MQTRIYFAFWKQKLKHVYTIILRPMILIQCLDIFLILAFCFSTKVGNRDDILPVFFTAYFNFCFIFTPRQTFSFFFSSCFYKIAASYLSKVNSNVIFKGSYSV